MDADNNQYSTRKTTFLVPLIAANLAGIPRPFFLFSWFMLSSRKKFIKSYVRPYNRLKRIKNGDGAYMALSMGFFLCERYYRIRSHTINRHHISKDFLEAAAKDFDCEIHLFRAFWALFRHGIQHQGSPKKKFRADWLPRKPIIRIKWAIGADLHYRPAYVQTDDVKRIGISPWKFTEFVMRKFLKNPQALEGAISHAFGDTLKQPKKVPVITQIAFNGRPVSP
jgi:hypothetical protein